MINKKEIENAQNLWAEALIEIGKIKDDQQRCEDITATLLDGLYDFRHPVLFKPTKAKVKQFRTTKESALSYFIGNNKNFLEDKGFALEPWIKIKFENEAFSLAENTATVMGNYYFTNSQNKTTKVEYTFGYNKVDNKLKIYLHHSSLPFQP